MIVFIIIFILLTLVISYTVNFSIKKANTAETINRHNYLRILILIVGIPLIFLVLYLIDGRNMMLGSIVLSFYFFGAWLLYLVIEAIIFYTLKHNRLANANLVLFILFLIIVSVSVIFYFNTVN